MSATSITGPTETRGQPIAFAQMSQRWIKLIVGYLEQRDYANADARVLNLNHRVAILLNAYRKQHVDYHFDSELAMCTLQHILKLIPHDACEFILERDGREVVASFQALCDHYAAQPPSVREPFWRGRVLKNDKVVAFIVVNNHNRPRAQHPYRGTYTFSIYSTGLDITKVEKAAQTAARKCGASLAGIEPGNDKPKISLLRRLHDFVVYDAEENEL